MVRKVECGHDQSLQEGDVILSLNGKLITRVSELDVMYDHEVLDAVIVRKSQEMQIKVPTVPTEDLETDRAVIFCGAILHAPHHAVRQQISKLHSEIYVSARVRIAHGVDAISVKANGNRREDPRLINTASLPPTLSLR